MKIAQAVVHSAVLATETTTYPARSEGNAWNAFPIVIHQTAAPGSIK
jgi:hypothetical protein